MRGKVAAVCVLGVLAWCAVDARPLAGAQAGAAPRGPGDVEAMHVQGKIWMLVTPDGNLALQVGDEGALLVDTGKNGTSDAVKAAIRKITTAPLRYVINTSAGPTRIGNNAAFGKSADADVNAARVAGPEIIAREAVLIQMSKANVPADAWPTDAYLQPERKFRFNGEAIEIIHQPSAYGDGDSIVYFRGSDVIVAGEIYSTKRFPLVDREHGGTVEGVLAGLNRIEDIAIPEVVVNSFAEGGTLVIPGSGRLSDQDDVTEYRDMVRIVRDRIVSLVKMNRSLDQVKAARPLIDYEGRYGVPEWTASMFLDALYAEVTRPTAARGGAR